MPPSTPISATYRLQFNKDFTFRAGAELLDYLSELGVTHIYASPILRSRHGSTHGYDVTDPTRLNPELDSEADFQFFHEELEKRGMGLLFAPLAASGKRQENISVYLRRHGQKALLVVLPRWLAAARASESSLASQEFWADTHVPLSASDPKSWRNVFTGETVSASQTRSPTHSLRIAELLRHFPVAMLEAISS